MSQNGPYPGPPSQPWSRGGSDEPYTEPADPWGDQPTPAGGSAWGSSHPTSMPSTSMPSTSMQPPPESSLGYPEPSSWGQPPPPPPRRRNTPIVALVVVLGLLILGGLGTTAWLLAHRDNTANGSVLPTTRPTTAANVAEPQPSEDARFVKRGECVRNEGSVTAPAMTIVPCASGTYEVLKRVDGKTSGEADAEAKCSKVPNYTKWYFYDTDLDSLDFVLCLRER
jgi:hypothetical protein